MSRSRTPKKKSEKRKRADRHHQEVQAQRFEVVPTDVVQMASTEAGREMRDEARMRGLQRGDWSREQRIKGDSKGKTDGKSKTKDKDKGKGKSWRQRGQVRGQVSQELWDLMEGANIVKQCRLSVGQVPRKRTRTGPLPGSIHTTAAQSRGRAATRSQPKLARGSDGDIGSAWHEPAAETAAGPPKVPLVAGPSVPPPAAPMGPPAIKSGRPASRGEGGKSEEGEGGGGRGGDGAKKRIRFPGCGGCSGCGFWGSRAASQFATCPGGRAAKSGADEEAAAEEEPLPDAEAAEAVKLEEPSPEAEAAAPPAEAMELGGSALFVCSCLRWLRCHLRQLQFLSFNFNYNLADCAT